MKLLTWSIGHHSSDMQQHLAKDFALFSLNEVNQTELMLNDGDVKLQSLVRQAVLVETVASRFESTSAKPGRFARP